MNNAENNENGEKQNRIVLEEPSLRERELIDRVDWFIQLRWLAVVGTFVVVFFLWHLFGMHFPLYPVIGITLFIFLYNIVFALVSKNLQSRENLTVHEMLIFANVQVFTDLVCLTLLIHYLGGVENYFVVFFFFHMVISSILLRPPNAYLIALVASLLLNGMIWGEYFHIIPHYHYAAIWGVSYIDSFQFQFFSSMILTFALFLSVYFSSSITCRLRQRELEVESAYAKLQRLDQEKSYFMKRVSHELRSPLSAVQSFVKIMLEGLQGELSSEQRNLLQRMDVRLSSLLDLVSDLLRFSKLRVLDQPQNIERIEFSEIIQNSYELLLAMAKEKGVKCRLDLIPASMVGEKEGLREIAINLISNAIKYTPSGGNVEIQLRVNSGHIHFVVKDSGIGIPEDEQSKVFSEFFRATNAREETQVGTGLGLAISKRVAEVHGGSIGFKSRVGQGTQFEVVLPLSGMTHHVMME